MQFLREENMVPSNFDQAEELSALMVKKTSFPYKDINNRDLDREYETCPPIKRFADNVLKKSKTEEEIQKLTPAYENVKKIWKLLNLKTVKTFAKIVWRDGFSEFGSRVDGF